MESPMEKFTQWWEAALVQSPLNQKSAVCVSTVGQDGMPSGRFVDLKGADEDGFTFCTYLDSAKGAEIRENPNVALTIWWDHVGYQVRIQGIAEPLPEDEAVKHWTARKREAQLTTLSFQQSQILEREEFLEQKLAEATHRYEGMSVPKPATWGGYRIRPRSIEFLTFRDTRLHKRELFDRDPAGAWSVTLLQP
jgi:pyridoxamine 5'-phosphate oxidase